MRRASNSAGALLRTSCAPEAQSSSDLVTVFEYVGSKRIPEHVSRDPVHPVILSSKILSILSNQSRNRFRRMNKRFALALDCPQRVPDIHRTRLSPSLRPSAKRMETPNERVRI